VWSAVKCKTGGVGGRPWNLCQQFWAQARRFQCVPSGVTSHHERRARSCHYMARLHDERLSSSTPSRPIDAIALQTRRPRAESAQDGFDDLHPESDASLLRKHHDFDDESDHDFDDLNTPKTSNIFSRIVAIMSKAPLLLRSSLAQGTGSYGALPVQEHDSDIEDTNDDVRRRDKRKASTDLSRTSTHSGISRTARARRGSASASRSFGRRIRRTSSNASDIGMGPDSKLSFATGSAHPERVFLAGVIGSPSGSTSEEEVIDSDGSTGPEEDPADNSPYPQVRATVPATDNTTLSISTPRMWTLSLIFALAGSATNLFFSLRYPSVAITPVIALVVVHPLGLLWDTLLKRDSDPKETFDNGILQERDSLSTLQARSRKRSFRLWLAQGRWNEKEHACVFISSNVSFGFAFATDVSY
jgi:hypothetical protein